MENFANGIRALCAEPVNQVSRELEDVKLELNAVKQRNATLEDRLERLEKSQQESQRQIQAQSDASDTAHQDQKAVVQDLRASHDTLRAQNQSLLKKVHWVMSQNDVLLGNGQALERHRSVATQVQTSPPNKSALFQPPEGSEQSSSSTLRHEDDAQVEQMEESSIHVENISHRNPAVTPAILEGLDPSQKSPNFPTNSLLLHLLEPTCAYSGEAGTEVHSPDPLHVSEDIVPPKKKRKRKAPSKPIIVPPVRSERRRKVNHVESTAAQSKANSTSQNSTDELADQLPDAVNVSEDDDDIDDTIVVQHPKQRGKSVSQLDGGEPPAWTLIAHNDDNARDVRKVRFSSPTNTASTPRTSTQQIQALSKVPVETMQTEDNDQESYARLRSKFRVRSGAVQAALEGTESLSTIVDEPMTFNRGSRGRLRKEPAKTQKAAGGYDI